MGPFLPFFGPDWLYLALSSGLKTVLGPKNFYFGSIALSCFFETFLGGLVAGLGWVAGWLENLILMQPQSSAQTWTWTLDFDLGFVNFGINQDKNQL